MTRSSPSTSRPCPTSPASAGCTTCPTTCPTPTSPRSPSQKRRVQTGSDFLPPHLQRVIVISLRAAQRRRRAGVLHRRARRERRRARSSASSTASTSTCRSSCRGTAAASTCRCWRTAALIHGVARRVLLGQRRRQQGLPLQQLPQPLPRAPPRPDGRAGAVPRRATRRSTSWRGCPAFPASSAWRARGVGELPRAARSREIRNYCEADSPTPTSSTCASSSCAAPSTAARYGRGMRPAARRAREARRAALARIPLPLEDLILEIDPRSTLIEGRGVARNPEGKVVFVEGALPRRARRVPGLSKETQVRNRPRHRDPRAFRRPARAALPALRRLRRLRHAARRRAHADGGQAARAGG